MIYGLREKFKKAKTTFKVVAATMLSCLKEAVTGMEPTNEPRMLERPRAIISWLESTGFPFAATSKKVRCSIV